MHNRRKTRYKTIENYIFKQDILNHVLVPMCKPEKNKKEKCCKNFPLVHCLSI